MIEKLLKKDLYWAGLDKKNIKKIKLIFLKFSRYITCAHVSSRDLDILSVLAICGLYLGKYNRINKKKE